MPVGMLGRKVGMSQIYNEKGLAVPVTVMEVGPNTVLQVRSPELDGYHAIQLGFADKKRKSAIRSERGHVANLESKRSKAAASAGKPLREKANCEPQRYIREWRTAAAPEQKVGDKVTVKNFEGVAAVLNAFNTYFKRSGTPVGIPKGKAVGLRDFQHWTDSVIANYPHDINSNAEARDAIDVYRQVLANQPDNSVTIVTVGFLTNLANLQNSAPDKWSKLNGKELIKKKVKLLVCMAGIFPKGKEFNVEKDAAASQQVFTTWETPIIFSGFDIGVKIFTGLPLIHNDKIQNSPVKDVFRISIPQDPKDSAGRKSWDETAVLVAIKGYESYYTLQGGHIEVDNTGFNTWSNVEKKQYYLVEKVPAKEVQDIINKLIMHQPRK